MEPTARKRAKPGPKRINRAYNEGLDGIDQRGPEARASDAVAVELCVAGPMRFAKLLRAMQYQPDFLARVLGGDERFVETRYGWDIKPLPKEGSKYEHGDARSTMRTGRTGKVARTV